LKKKNNKTVNERKRHAQVCWMLNRNKKKKQRIQFLRKRKAQVFLNILFEQLILKHETKIII